MCSKCSFRKTILEAVDITKHWVSVLGKALQVFIAPVLGFLPVLGLFCQQSQNQSVRWHMLHRRIFTPTW